MRIDLHHHYHSDPELLRAIAHLSNLMELTMSTLDTLLADVQAQKTQIDSVAALLHSIKTQLADALSGEKLSPAAEAKLAAILPLLEANTAKITEAINENTDAAPTPVVEPAPVEPAVEPAPTPTPVDPGVPSI